jgi:hypothetical protein
LPTYEYEFVLEELSSIEAWGMQESVVGRQNYGKEDTWLLSILLKRPICFHWWPISLGKMSLVVVLSVAVNTA